MAPEPEGGPLPGPTVRALRAVGRLCLGIRRPLAAVLVAAWMGFIWYMSSSRGRHAMETFDLGVLWNNFLHAPAYGFLAYLVLLGIPRREDGWPRIDRAGVLWTLGVVVGYAVVDEVHQSFVPQRVPSVTDILTNAVGASCVLWIAAYLGGRPAGDRGVWWRLVLGLSACWAAAGLATVA